jgi:hypothetical protein
MHVDVGPPGGLVSSVGCANVRAGAELERVGVIDVIVIVGAVLAAIGFSASVAIGLGRMAARADTDMERLLTERRSHASAIPRQSYARLAAGQSNLMRDPDPMRLEVPKRQRPGETPLIARPRREL